jgi:hypothetical protein
MSRLFNGTWQIDLDQSLVWDDALKSLTRIASSIPTR